MTYINDALAPLTLFKTDDFEEQVHDNWAIDVLEHVRDNIVE